MNNRTTGLILGLFGLGLFEVCVQALPAIAQETTLVAQQNDPQNDPQNDSATADALLIRALALYDRGDANSLRESIALSQQALQLYRAAGNVGREATALSNIGLAYNSLGERAQALDYYNQSLPLSRQVGDRNQEATTLTNIGLTYASTGDKESALSYYNQALTLSREIGNQSVEAALLINLGSVSNAIGNKTAALAYYDQALPLLRQLGNRASEAVVLSNIGLVYSSLGQPENALSYYEQALVLMRRLGNRVREATTLNNIGSVYRSLGKKDEALDYYNRSLTLIQQLGNREYEAATLNNIGSLYDLFGEKEQALAYFEQALALSKQVGDRGGESVTLVNIGLLYSTIGELEKSLTFYNQALALMRQSGSLPRVAKTLINIGNVYRSLGEQQDALAYFDEALPLMRQVGDLAGEANTLNSIGLAQMSLGNTADALAYYNQALPLSREAGDRVAEAAILSNLGQVNFLLGNQAEALAHYTEAIALMRQVGDRPGEANALGSLAILYTQQGELPTALTTINEAITLIEALRVAIAPGDLRASYFSTVQDYYQLQLDLQMQLAQPEAAFEASEASRARLLLELLSESSVNIRQGVNPTLLEQEHSLQQQITQLEQRRIETRSQDHTPEQAAILDAQSDEALQRLDQVIAQIRRSSPAYAEIVQPQPLTLAQIQQEVLEADTVLMQYALGKERSYLWLIGKDSFQAYTLRGEADIQKVAQQFQSAISTQGSAADVKRKGDELVAQIFPERPDWLQGKRLLVAGDGILSELPFAALPLPNQSDYIPLLAEHEVLTQPSITAVSVLRNQLSNREPLPPSLAILADPVYRVDDERLGASTRAAAQLSTATERNLRDLDLRSIERLPFTRTESDRILQLAKNSGINNTSALDFEADSDWVNSPELANYSLIHLATHGFINPVNPQLSGIVLALVDENGQLKENGFLRLHDIFNLKLAAELVVLSACQTGQGENISGEGIVGLSRGFMYAGAERVAVSLWNVNDEATAILMGEFYRYLLEDEITPAAAMRAAQLDAWQAGQSPYLWAAFTLQGEWQ